MSDASSCNILVIGKTGVGKSSLLRYVFGAKCKTGTGKPVTGYGIYPYEVTVDQKKAVVSDSWGIEAGSTKEWKNLLDRALADHGIGKPPKDWFHAILYCIDASGSRIQKFDTDLIGMLLESGFHLTVVLTKADLVTDSGERQKMKTELLKAGLQSEQIVFFSSGGETRFGKTDPFGAGELKKLMFSGWQETIIRLLPKRCKKLLFDEIQDFSYRSKHLIDALDIAFANNQENMDLIRSEVKSFQRTVNQYILPTIVNRELSACVDISYTMVDMDGRTGTSASNVVGLHLPPTASLLLKASLLLRALGDAVKTESLLSPDTLWEWSSTVRSRMKEYIDFISEEMKKQYSPVEDRIREKLRDIFEEPRSEG